MTNSRTIAFAAAVAIGTIIGSLAPANAGILGDVAAAVGNKVKERAQERAQPQQGQQSKSQFSWMDKINPKYTQCVNNVWNQTLPQYKTQQLHEAIQDNCASKYKPL